MIRLEDNEHWNFTCTEYRGKNRRYNGDYIARGMSMALFMKTIDENSRNGGGISWIRDRITQSHNEFDNELTKLHDGIILYVEDKKILWKFDPKNLTG